MKYLLATIFIIFSYTLYSQAGYKSSRNYGPTMTVQDYVQFSPGNTFATSRLVAEYRDSLYYRILYKNLRIDYLGSSNSVYLKTDNLGNMSNGLITDIFDPTQYYNKTQSDSRYLQSFTETDPIFITDSNLFAKKTYSYSKAQSDIRYLQSFTESDPIFSSSTAFSITPTLVSNWNTSFSWGDHSLVGYTTSSSTNTFTNKSGNISQWTNDSGYLTGINSLQVITALGYTPPNPNGTNLQYISGDGSKITFPSIPSAQVNSDWNSISGVSQILNKPAIPAQVNITGGKNTKITGTYPNINIADSTSLKAYNTSGVVNQNIKVWSTNVTPSTSNGYSIDISSAGFTTILSASVIAVKNTSSASTSPNVSIKTKSTTAIVVNVIEDNPSTVTILGINVLNGAPSIFANTTGLTLDVQVIGY